MYPLYQCEFGVYCGYLSDILQNLVPMAQFRNGIANQVSQGVWYRHQIFHFIPDSFRSGSPCVPQSFNVIKRLDLEIGWIGIVFNVSIGNIETQRNIIFKNNNKIQYSDTYRSMRLIQSFGEILAIKFDYSWTICAKKLEKTVYLAKVFF